VIDPKRLAAIDLVFLGPKFVIAEFAAGVLLSGGIGLFILARSLTSRSILLGLYFVSLSLNYVPMLVHAMRLAGTGAARAELGAELEDVRRAMGKYRRQSLWLLVPLAPVIAGVKQMAGRQKDRK
jgi:hypothetical protein